MDVALLRFLRHCCILSLGGIPCASGISVARAAGSGDEAPLGQQDGTTAGAKDLRFIRIQKTGGSIFGDLIMKKFSGQPADGVSGSLHDDWSQATENGAYRGNVVTLLRDPVERIMSEFFWLRSADGRKYASNADWDFRNETWLNIVQTHKDIAYALDVYLHGCPTNPSRNRQTMYLLGFRDGKKGEEAYRVESPGSAYDWDTNSGRYVRLALENLESMTAYGITDCWMPSMRAIARQLGWDTKAVEEFALSSTPEYGKHEIDAATFHSRVNAGVSFRRTLSRDKIKDIEVMNKVDMLVFRKALKRFVERFGEACSLPYEPFGPVVHELKAAKK
mmetsp:Transcript_86874/g.270093  ORF Transcript_86874/g.270093 Transcript_86874/m.270093 type:complete len:334 (-) Transcript_86874:7-1008(-)